MPQTSARKKEYDKEYYARNQVLKATVAVLDTVFSGGRPQTRTMNRLHLNEALMKHLRDKDHRAFGQIELRIGAEKDSLWNKYKDRDVHPMRRGETRPVYRIDDVAEPKPPKGYDQGLEVVPLGGSGGKVSWEQIQRFWSSAVIQQYKLGTNQALFADAAQSVPILYKETTKKGKREFFNRLRLAAGAGERDDAIPYLQDTDAVSEYLKGRYKKTAEKQLADATVASGSLHAVAGGDADEGDEASSPSPARTAKEKRRPSAQAGVAMVRSAHGESRRVRDTAPELKTLTATFAKSLGHIIATAQAWKAFREALGTRALSIYQGSFRNSVADGRGPSGQRAAAAAAKEAQQNKTKSDWYAVPSVKLLQGALERMRKAPGMAETFDYLTAYLHVTLLGLRDNLGGVRMLKQDGHRYRDGEPDSMRKSWYNSETGRLYIAIFKTAGSMAGQPYDFPLPDSVRAVIDGVHSKHKSPYLVGVAVNKNTGLPLSARPRLKRAFAAIKFYYNKMGPKGLVRDVPTALDIRHSQVTEEHRRLEKEHKNWTADQIAQKIAGSFQHSPDVNITYLRKTFDSLQSDLATKAHLGGKAAPPAGEDEYDRGMPDEAMGPPADSGEGSGDSGESGGESGAGADPPVPRRPRSKLPRKSRFAPTAVEPPAKVPAAALEAPAPSRRSARLAGRR